MPRTYRKRRRSKKSKRGGNYYPYNKSPVLFTKPSNPQFGGWAGDYRSTFLPDMVTDMARSAQYSSQASINSFLGKAPPVNPSVLSQPINK
jgi:hypothetical protein